jgi:hypothetical protein
LGGLQAIAAMKRTNIPAAANIKFPIDRLLPLFDLTERFLLLA